MAKKIKSVELSEQNITFVKETLEYKVIRFHPASMTVDVKELGEKKGLQQFAFAHLPKTIKQLIKPN